jgi:hypothetical protein
MPRPRRRIPRATGGEGRTLDPATEWELSLWGGLRIDGMGLDSLEEFRAAWDDHGAAITAAWRLSMPGSRPFGCYATGQIPPPAVVVPPYPDDAGRRIGERIFFEAHVHGAGDERELAHLVALDLVDAAEERAARRRIAAHGPRCLYQWVGSAAASADTPAKI